MEVAGHTAVRPYEGKRPGDRLGAGGLPGGASGAGAKGAAYAGYRPALPRTTTAGGYRCGGGMEFAQRRGGGRNVMRRAGGSGLGVRKAEPPIAPAPRGTQTAWADRGRNGGGGGAGRDRNVAPTERRPGDRPGAGGGGEGAGRGVLRSLGCARDDNRGREQSYLGTIKTRRTQRGRARGPRVEADGFGSKLPKQQQWGGGRREVWRAGAGGCEGDGGC